MSEPRPYELYALRYATATRKPGEVFIGADPHEAAVSMDYFVWVARNELHTVVIDTGFDAAAAQRRGRQLLREPGDALALLGVACDQVKHVIITHLHYDHAGNLQLFPRARFHLQQSEMVFATGPHMAHPFFAHAYRLEGVLSMSCDWCMARRCNSTTAMPRSFPGITVHPWAATRSACRL
jgi:glyoxylase-like metal-dependent hydrolase (beta-lactamase superfamily II)